MIYLILTNKEELIEDVKVMGNLAGSDHDTTEFMILRLGKHTVSRRILDCKRMNFN